jgi:hypothetical protein
MPLPINRFACRSTPRSAKNGAFTVFLRNVAVSGYVECFPPVFAGDIRRCQTDALRGDADEGYPPLTKAQLAAIRKHEPKRKGRALSSLLEMTTRPWAPRPNAGDVVQCRFPEHKVGTPGPKDRPALVIEVEEDPEDEAASIVRVAYETSQDVERRHPGELTVRATDPKAGLERDTKFDLGYPAPDRPCEPGARSRGDADHLARGERLRSVVKGAGGVIPVWITGPAKVTQGNQGPGFPVLSG